MANILAAQAGNYSNPATWVGGVVPTTDDIACCGTFRITLDISPLAAISDANLDWVAGGGAELGTTYTGGFNIPNGATIVIPVYRYSFTRNATFTATTCSLYITNGNVTITEAVVVGTPTTFGRPSALVNPTTTLVLTVGTAKLSNVHNASANYGLFDINFSSSANVTMTFGDIIPVAGSSVGMSLLSTNSAAPAHLDITFTGKIFSRVTSHTVVINTSSVPVGTSRIRVLSPEIALGTGIGGILNINNFKTAEFADLSLLTDSLSTSTGLINCTNIVTSVVVNSDITSCGRHTLVFSGTGTFTVNGDIRKITKVGVSPNTTCLALQNMIGDITINGDVINDGTLFSSGAAGYPVVQVGNANVILNSLIMVGSTTLGILIQLSAPGKTMTFNSDVDCSAVIVESSSTANIYAGVLCSATNGHHILVKGDVKGHDSPSSTALLNSAANNKSGAIMITGTLQGITVEGVVYAGRACAAITVESSIDFPITVKKVVSGANLFSTALAPPAIYTTVQHVTVDELDFGAEGRFPVMGYIDFRKAAPAIITAKNADGSPCVLVEQGDGLATLAANVRAGVTIGSTVGTLTVPAANTVLDGVVYDNGTVGTLDVEETVVVDFSAVTSAVNAIKAKTDQLTFTGGNVNAASESVPLVTVANAIADGFWSSASIWDTGVVPDASTFVYTNGKAVTVSSTVNCAGYADTPSGGDGIVVDEDGNAVLVSSFGDTLFSDNKILATLQGNLSNVGSATLSANSYAMGYGTAPVALFGRTQFARKSAFDDPIQAGVVFPMPLVNNSVGLTVEFWWYPVANNNNMFFAGSYVGLIPTYGNLEFFNGGYNTQIGGSRVSLAGLAPITTQWNHCVIQRTKAGAVEVYINGVRVMNQSSAPTIAAGNWQLFAAQSSYSAGLLGYFSELRVTLSSSGTRYNGNFTVPTAPFIDYPPPPGTSLSGRLILQNNGAVIQSTVAPTVSVAGILSSLSRYTRAYIGQVGDNTGAIKAKTDLLTFGSTGVVTEGGSGSGTDYTTRFDDLDLAVAAIPTLTYTARLNSIDTDLGNLIANNMRNNLVAGVVGSTGFIGLWNDTSTELSGGTPAYQRQAVVWSAPFNGIVTNTTDITINVPAGGTVAYIAGYTLVTGGTAQFSYACTEVDAVSQSVYTIPAGTLQMITTVQ